MGEAGVADGEVNADGGAETGQAGDEERFPQRSRRRSVQDAEEHGESAAAYAATKTSPIMRDERNEARIGRTQVRRANVHVFQVLRHKDGRHTDAQNDQAAQHQAG